MWTNQVSIEIAAPLETVYRYLADFARHGEWSMSVTTLEQLTPGPVRVGTEFKSTETLPQEFVSFARITALDEPARIAWESTDHQVFRTNWEFEITPHGQNTHLVQRVTFHPISDFGKEFMAVRTPQVEPENVQSLHRIRANLER